MSIITLLNKERDKTMSKGQKIESIRRYVEESCKSFLIAHEDVTDIEYRHSGNMDGGKAFIKISTAFHTANFYNVTDMDCDKICILICTIMVGVEPNEKLRDKEIIREVATLFAR